MTWDLERPSRRWHYWPFWLKSDSNQVQIFATCRSCRFSLTARFATCKESPLRCFDVAILAFSVGVFCIEMKGASMAHVPKRAVQHGIYTPLHEVSPPCLKPGQKELNPCGLYSTEAKQKDALHKSRSSWRMVGMSQSTQNEFVRPFALRISKHHVEIRGQIRMIPDKLVLHIGDQNMLIIQ